MAMRERRQPLGIVKRRLLARRKNPGIAPGRHQPQSALLHPQLARQFQVKLQAKGAAINLRDTDFH